MRRPACSSDASAGVKASAAGDGASGDDVSAGRVAVVDKASPRGESSSCAAASAAAIAASSGELAAAMAAAAAGRGNNAWRWVRRSGSRSSPPAWLRSPLESTGQRPPLGS